MHRALSWLKCAENKENDPDHQFISLWISFNACYADDISSYYTDTEKVRLKRFVNKLVQYDPEKRFYNLLWQKFSGPVRLLIENRYVYKPFWDFQRKETRQWEPQFQKSVADANHFLAKNKVPELLEVVLDRLYVLRNQIVHGGATYKSRANRSQVRDGCNMLKLLMPVIIEIILDNSNEDWGKVYYPVVDFDYTKK
jgi:hypothetical protein